MLDHSKEKHQHAQIHIAAYQQQIWAAHHKKVKLKKFLVRDLVLRRVIQSTRQKDHVELGPNREGPIIIVHGGNGSYTLADQGGNQLNKQWNSFYLKRYYI